MKNQSFCKFFHLRKDPDSRKPKRRSKHDQEGRSFSCTIPDCNKIYLSYPALYTHMKTKHKHDIDSGNVQRQFTTRGRGRPWKIALNDKPHVIATDLIEADAEKKRLEINEASDRIFAKLGV